VHSRCRRGRFYRLPRGPPPTAASVATSLACTDSLHCWATASDTTDPSHAVGSIDATTDGGTSWIPQTVPAGTGAINAVDCVPPATGSAGGSVTCTAVGTTSTVINGTRTGQGLVLTSGGGATWSTEPVPPGVADLLDVPWDVGAGVTPEELAEIVASLRAWQLGETSDGARLLKTAEAAGSLPVPR